MDNTPTNQIPPNTQLENKKKGVGFNIFIIALELFIVFLYSYFFSLGGWDRLSVLFVSIILGTPLGIFGIFLSISNYKQSRKIYALIIFILSLSITLPFAGDIGQTLAPIIFPSVRQHEKERLERESTPPGQLTPSEIERYERFKIEYDASTKK